MINAIKLSFEPNGVDFFSNLFFAFDHNSEDRNFFELFKILLLWQCGQYHVFVAMEDDMPFGICHGQQTHEDFHGHLYFLPNYRGKKAFNGALACLEVCRQNFKLKRILANIKEDNLKARAFVSCLGFVRENDTYVLHLGE